MRNIALLEWGPASLFYIQPRERIKVRTVWLEGGPIMPPFLSTRDESKASSSAICVRYALSAFEDLSKAIRNLRRCFGFPYQEYIGYLNTLSRSHRARREHEALVDRLRKWAIFGNVDAVIWIDYAKANQPPGSFKMGPRDSRPFSRAHMELCADLPQDECDKNNGDVDSEAAWSDIEEEAGERGAAPRVTEASHEVSLSKNEVSLTQGDGKISVVLQRGHSAGTVPLKRLIRASELADQKALSMSARESFKASRGPSSERERSNEFKPGFAERSQSARAMQENALLRTMIQEEIVPGHGSIYIRSIAPGPGYYGVPGFSTLEEGGVGQFGHRPRSRIDAIMEAQKDQPGPGEYTPRARQLEDKAQLGKIGKAPRLVPASEIARKLPFISKEASTSEGYGLQSDGFHVVPSDSTVCARAYTKPPKYSFGKMKRPF